MTESEAKNVARVHASKFAEALLGNYPKTTLNDLVSTFAKALVTESASLLTGGFPRPCTVAQEVRDLVSLHARTMGEAMKPEQGPAADRLLLTMEEGQHIRILPSQIGPYWPQGRGSGSVVIILGASSPMLVTETPEEIDALLGVGR